MKTIELTDEQYQVLQSVLLEQGFKLCEETKEAAEKARAAMRTHNRLLAWLAENDDGWVADWNKHEQAKFSLFQNVYNGFWSFENNTQYMKLGTVYMSYQNAEKLCKLLNDGMIEL